jgi:hypothetical protein
MSTNRSIPGNLMQRRVPQIVGMYVAASWLVIELGDWATQRFGLPANLTSYVFVAMIVMLPAVILMAYNHGAPGKDQWTRPERLVLPVNAAIAVAVLYFVSPALDVEARTEMVRIADETGALQEFEVARQGYHREVIGFFAGNESGNPELDWLSYGFPIMLAYDLNRVSPVLSVTTPFDSTSISNELKELGYESLMDEPTGLRLKIARDRHSAAVISGSFAVDGDLLTLSATLTDAESGAEIGSHSVTGSDWFEAVDDISAVMLDYLGVKPGDNQRDDPIRRHFSDSIEAIEHFTNAQVALALANDYALAITELQAAVELDSAFAEASGELSRSQYLTGDVESARTTIAQALRNSYRLSDTSSFVYKANRYIYDGDFERGERVLDMWTEVRPNSTSAYRAQAQLAKLRGGDEALDKANAAYDRVLELEPTAFDIYLRKAEVEQQRGDYGAAADYLRLFLESRPDSADGHVHLAGIYQAQGDLDAAQAELEDAAILSDNPLESELGLARIEARRGLWEAADARLAGQMSDTLTTWQRVDLLSAQTELALIRGRIAHAMQLHAEIVRDSASLLAPMVLLVSVENEQTALLAQLGRFDEAVAIADEIYAQLQPPFDSYMYISYANLYAAADDREAFRQWAARASDARSQLPAPFYTFLEVNSARLAIWDGDLVAAVAHIDQARELLGQSLIQMMHSNLSVASVHVRLAELYLDANAAGKAQEYLDDILKAFPAYPYAKLVSARAHLANGDEVTALKLVNEALEAWAEADEDYVHRQQALALRDSLLSRAAVSPRPGRPALVAGEVRVNPADAQEIRVAVVGDEVRLDQVAVLEYEGHRTA